jgi:hypothetical protein
MALPRRGDLGGAKPTRAFHPVEDDVLGRAGSRPRSRRARAHPQRPLPALGSRGELIREFVETRCFSAAKESYIRHAGSDELDASLLLGVLLSYGDPASDRWAGTIDAVRRELQDGLFVRRYTGRGRSRGIRRGVSDLLVLARGGARRERAARRGRGADGPARGAGQRRRPLRRGGRPGHRCLPRELPARPQPPGVLSAPRSQSPGGRGECLGRRCGRIRRDGGAHHRASGREPAQPDTHGPAVPAGHGLHERPDPRQGARLHPALLVRAGVRADLLRPLPRDRPERVVARSGLRLRPRRVLRYRARQHLAPAHPPADGQPIDGRPGRRPARAAGLPHAHLRRADAARQHRCPHRLRSARGRLHLARWAEISRSPAAGPWARCGGEGKKHVVRRR